MHLEDVAITGQLREGTGVNLVDAQRFILTHPARSTCLLCHLFFNNFVCFVSITTPWIQQGRKGGAEGESCHLPPGEIFALPPTYVCSLNCFSMIIAAFFLSTERAGTYFKTFLIPFNIYISPSRSLGGKIEKIGFS